MKNIKKLLSICLTTIIAMCLLCSCNGNSKKADTKKNAGIYKLTSISSGSASLTEDMVQAQEGFGLVSFIKLQEDGNVIYSVDGAESKGTWDNKEITISGEGAEYSFKGDNLTINKSGMKMEFKKSTQAEIDEILSRASKGE